MATFGENLQSLRKQRNMTQEELAEKMEVSRQTVSKWENEGVYPETEKILRLCNLFSVSMDELMRGNTAQKNEDGLREYDREMNRFSLEVSLAVGLILLGVAGLLLILGFAPALETLIAIPLFVALAISIAVLIVAGLRHDDYVKGHPTLDFVYPQEEVRAFDTPFRAMIAGSVALIMLCVLALMLLAPVMEVPDEAISDRNSAWVMAGFMTGIAIATTVLIYAGMKKNKYDIQTYNLENNLNDTSTPARRKRLAGKIETAIMLAATAIYLLLGFVWDYWYQGAVAFPIGGIILGGGKE